MTVEPLEQTATLAILKGRYRRRPAGAAPGIDCTAPCAPRPASRRPRVPGPQYVGAGCTSHQSATARPASLPDRWRDRGAVPGSGAGGPRPRAGTAAGRDFGRGVPTPPRSRPSPRYALPSPTRPEPPRASSSPCLPHQVRPRIVWMLALPGRDRLLQRRVRRPGQGDLQPDILIARGGSPRLRQALALQPQHGAGAGVPGNGHGDGAVERRNGDLRAAHGFAQGQWQGQVDIGILALEHRVRPHPDLDQGVALWPAPDAGAALALQAEHLP